ncbi:MAG: DUF3089 domain-containing protein [Lachnospiraceae bacterium]|nr:DUF3089 domain-containing protein [Lachnospiraceae bacterium]
MAGYKVTDLKGVPTDYSDKNNWVHIPENNDKEVDTFFVYPTVYMNPAPDAPVIVPVEDEMLRAAVQGHFNEAPQAFADLTNLYEPYYRQSNLCAVAGLNQYDFMEYQKQEQRTDIYAALDYYFEHYNEGRPFMLAGHSQGSMMLKLALREYFKEHTDYLERMVAAYIIGYAITTDDLETNPALKFAEGADDTGVIVSWNTEGPENMHENNITVMKNSISINPLNWKRDETYAPASENQGDRLPVFKENEFLPSEFQTHRPGLADAKLDVERGVVVCTTLSDRYVKPIGVENLFGPASLHLVDYTAYWDSLRENVKTRIKAYLNRK